MTWWKEGEGWKGMKGEEEGGREDEGVGVEDDKLRGREMKGENYV